MATYRVSEESFAVGIEATAGEPAALTLEAHSIEVSDESSMGFEESTLERANYLRADNKELPPRPQRINGTATLKTPVKGVDAALDNGADTDWDSRGIDALLRSCGYSVAVAAGMRTYSIGGTETCTIEMTKGPLWQQMAGCAGNVVIEADGGATPIATFDMKGTFDLPVTGAIAGSTADFEAVAPPHLRGYATIGTLTDLMVRSVKFDAGVQSAPRLINGGRPVAVYKAFQNDNNAAWSDETSEANTTAGDEVQPFPGTPVANEDSFDVGHRLRFCGIKVTIGTQVATDVTVTAQYYNGSSWATLTTGLDEVDDLDQAVGTYQMTWDPPEDWTPVAVNSVTCYWVRLAVTAVGGAETSSDSLTRVWAILPGHGIHSFVPVSTPRKTRLTVVAELEALTTWDPWAKFHYGNAADETVKVPLGSGANNTWHLDSTTAFYTKTPEPVPQDGIWVVNFEMGLQDHTWRVGTVD